MGPIDTDSSMLPDFVQHQSFNLTNSKIFHFAGLFGRNTFFFDMISDIPHPYSVTADGERELHPNHSEHKP